MKRRCGLPLPGFKEDLGIRTNSRIEVLRAIELAPVTVVVEVATLKCRKESVRKRSRKCGFAVAQYMKKLFRL